MGDLAALHDGHARYVLGYAHALLGTRELAEEASLEVLLTGWRAGLAQEADRRAARLLLMSLVRREVAALQVRVPQLLLTPSGRYVDETQIDCEGRKIEPPVRFSS